MKTILAINPRKKKKRTNKKKATNKRATRSTTTRKKGAIMAAKRKRKRTAKPATKAISRRRSYKRNPAPKKRRRSATAARGAASILRNLKPMESVVDSAKQVGGMLCTQFFAKRFAAGGGANDPNWTWKNYTWGLGGAFVAGIGAEMIKRGSGREFLKGGLSLLGYKLVTNELAEKSTFVKTWLGETDSVEELMYSDEDLAPASYLGEDGEVYLLGQDGNYYPELVSPSSMGSDLVTPGALGDDLVYPGALGQDPFQEVMGR